VQTMGKCPMCARLACLDGCGYRGVRLVERDWATKPLPQDEEPGDGHVHVVMDEYAAGQRRAWYGKCCGR